MFRVPCCQPNLDASTATFIINKYTKNINQSPEIDMLVYNSISHHTIVSDTDGDTVMHLCLKAIIQIYNL